MKKIVVHFNSVKFLGFLFKLLLFLITTIVIDEIPKAIKKTKSALASFEFFVIAVSIVLYIVTIYFHSSLDIDVWKQGHPFWFVFSVILVTLGWFVDAFLVIGLSYKKDDKEPFF